MKRLLLYVLCSWLCFTANSQVAKWIIPPHYDDITMVDGLEAVMTDSAGVKTIWTMEGNKLLSSINDIHPYREKVAVSTVKNSWEMDKVFHEDGSSMSVEGCTVAHNYPFFSNGVLLVKKGGFYKYMCLDGSLFSNDYLKAYPFFNGYAACTTYLNMEKKRDLGHYLLTTSGNPITFIWNDKMVDINDLEFVSSVNDENVGVVVIKRKVFFFNGETKELSPVFHQKEETNIKNQAKIDKEIALSLQLESDSVTLLRAFCGKTHEVLFRFDSMLRPISLTRSGDTLHYHALQKEKELFSSVLSFKQQDEKYALYWGDEEILPAQFDGYKQCVGHLALVKTNNKFGMMSVDKEDGFGIRMNKGDDIAFRHQKFETVIRVDLPTTVLAEKTSIEIDSSTGCNIDKTSKMAKNTDSGNFVQYNCVLNIPQSLPDTLTRIEYPVQILYDGFKSAIQPFTVNAWYYKYFVVDVDDTQTAIENGTVTFVFNINAERLANETVYPTTVTIHADSLHYDLEKMSEIRYKCRVESLNEGVNNINIEVLEQGCPPASFPFEVEYQKPVPRTKKKESVVFKKKQKELPLVIIE